jgi:hypothetical protein
VTIFDEDGVPTPTWQISFSHNPSELVVPLYVRDRLGLRTNANVPALSPQVRAIPSKHLDVAAASASWDSVWEVIALGGRGGYFPFTPVRFYGLTGHPALIGPWAWLYEEASAWEAALPGGRELVAREQRDPLHDQKLVADLENELARPVKPFHLEFTVLPVDGVWWERTADGRVFLSGALVADPETYTPVLRRLLEPVA